MITGFNRTITVLELLYKEFQGSRSKTATIKSEPDYPDKTLVFW